MFRRQSGQSASFACNGLSDLSEILNRLADFDLVPLKTGDLLRKNRNPLRDLFYPRCF